MEQYNGNCINEDLEKYAQPQQGIKAPGFTINNLTMPNHQQEQEPNNQEQNNFSFVQYLQQQQRFSNTLVQGVEIVDDSLRVNEDHEMDPLVGERNLEALRKLNKESLGVVFE